MLKVPFHHSMKRIWKWNTTSRSPAEKLWMECGVVGDVKTCDRAIYKLVRYFMLLYQRFPNLYKIWEQDKIYI